MSCPQYKTLILSFMDFFIWKGGFLLLKTDTSNNVDRKNTQNNSTAASKPLFYNYYLFWK